MVSKKNQVVIGLDVMGGDFAPSATIEGALLAKTVLNENEKIVLFGNQELIKEELVRLKKSINEFAIVNCSDAIIMSEHPVKAIINKPNSSIGKGFEYLKSKKINAFASAGNSGAMLYGAIRSVNTIQGIIRPCTSTVLPQESGAISLLLDVGTNPDAKPDVLYQFGVVGSALASRVYAIEKPRIALLNIGAEDEKGSLTVQSAFQQMKNSKDFNFIGNIEGRDILRGKADVIVCDGFSGNVLLKTLESIYRIFIKREIKDDYFSRFNYENYGGTPILGVNATVILGHGISNSIAIKNMIIQAKNVHNAKLVSKIKNAMKKSDIAN